AGPAVQVRVGPAAHHRVTPGPAEGVLRLGGGVLVAVVPAPALVVDAHNSWGGELVVPRVSPVVVLIDLDDVLVVDAHLPDPRPVRAVGANDPQHPVAPEGDRAQVADIEVFKDGAEVGTVRRLRAHRVHLACGSDPRAPGTSPATARPPPVESRFPGRPNTA